MKLARLLHHKLIASHLTDENQRSREIVLNWLLFGLFCLGTTAFIGSAASFFWLDRGYVATRLLSITIFLGLIISLHWLVRRRHWHRQVAAIMLAMLLFVAVMVLYTWGILTPTGLLLLGLAVVMAGILLDSRFSLYMIGAAALVLGGLEYAKTRGAIQPDVTWMRSGSGVGDVVVFSTIFAILGLVCWLFNRQMELSLGRATRAEAALLKQNESLEQKVKERTRQLEKEQLDRMQNMYRFAELGHVSTALFHDLANHLSTVSLDIENLHKETQPEILRRIDDNIHYIDTIVRRVRSQLQGKVKVETFDIKTEIREVAKVSALTAAALDVTIDLRFENNQPLRFRGDVLRFRQVMINLLSNAVEAYKGMKTETKHVVEVKLSSDKRHAVIEVTDHGLGIPPSIRERIFDPFYTSKDKGVGIGLFIVRQVMDRDLKGEVKLLKTGPEGTTFMLKLPLRKL